MIRLRATEPADLPELGDLFHRAFGHPLAAAEWEWKYRRLPGAGRSVVAVDGGGRVVAHAGALRFPARWSGGEGGIWQLADFAGSPRGHGLRPPLVELGRWLLADLPGAGEAPWIFGFPSRRHFRLGQRVFGYLPLERWRELEGELAPVAEAARAAGTDRLPAEPTDRPWEGVEAVWEACGVSGVRRSEAFLAWRYWCRPDRYYRFYRLAGGGVEGLAVVAFVGSEARAAELWLPPAGEWRGALGAVAADLYESGLRRWRFWPPAGRGGEEALRDLGLAQGEEVIVDCRGAVGAPDPRPAAAGFHYAMGDYDVT